MSFAYHGFSSYALSGNAKWATGFFSAVLLRDTHTPDPSQIMLSDIPATQRPTPKVQIQGRLVSDGAAYCADIVFPKVPYAGFTYVGCAVFADTAVEGSSPLWLYLDHGTGWPLTPNGGNVAIQIDPGDDKLFRIGTYPC
jgi:hypothetical protein